MQFDFDHGNNTTNLSKYDLSLAAVAKLSWEAAFVWLDDQADYGEARMVALAPLEDTLFFVAFVGHKTLRRIIDLRRANRRTVRHYVKVTQEHLPEDANAGGRSVHPSGGGIRSGCLSAHRRADEIDSPHTHGSRTTKVGKKSS